MNALWFHQEISVGIEPKLMIIVAFIVFTAIQVV